MRCVSLELHRFEFARGENARFNAAASHHLGYFFRRFSREEYFAEKIIRILRNVSDGAQRGKPAGKGTFFDRGDALAAKIGKFE